MKKLLILVFVFLIILGGVENDCSFSLLNYFSGEYCVYTSTETNNSLNLGFCYMSSNPVQDNVIGESMTIENFEVGSAIKTLNAKVVKTEYLDDGTTVIYAYTRLIEDKVEIFGNSVNLQIATRDDKTTIGWPLIFGSF